MHIPLYNATNYFQNVTDRQKYDYVNIMEFRGDGYVLTNKISDRNIQEMRMNMDESDIEEFDAFVEKNWGNGVKKQKVANKS